MFTLQVYTEERGWRLVTAVWEDEVGWCFIDSPAHPARFARIEDAVQEAALLAAECNVLTAVYSEQGGVRLREFLPASSA